MWIEVTYIHSITASGLFAGMAFCESLDRVISKESRIFFYLFRTYPVERVGESVFSEISEHTVIDLESSKIC